MPSGTGPTATTTTTTTKAPTLSVGGSNPSTGAERKQDNINSNEAILYNRSTSHDPTAYVQRARVTRAAPPKPATNPLQFIQIKPCQLYQSAAEQLKRAEEVKKVKEVKKEEPEDWQSNLDNWKSCRRKRVEHIIDRVVESKKLEMEEHDRTRRKSKTFSEMMEDRSTKGRKCSLAVYAEDDSNDLSDLGIGTSSASGKSSLSEDFDNHSVISDNQENDKNHSDVDNNSNHENGNGGSGGGGGIGGRDYISSPGYDTSSSTAPASSPDPCEYEGSHQAYKTRALTIQATQRNHHTAAGFTSSSSASSRYASSSKDSTPERSSELQLLAVQPPPPPPKRPSLTKIENRLLNFEIKGSSQEERIESPIKKDLPKVDILKRRELFEKETSPSVEKAPNARVSTDFSQAISIRERMSNLEKRDEVKDASIKKLNRLSGEEFGSVKDRLTCIEREPQVVQLTEKPVVDVPIVALKDRLSSLHANVKLAIDADYTTNDHHIELHPIVNNDGPLHHMTNHLHYFEKMDAPLLRFSPSPDLHIDHFADTDREDSGIHTADVSCAVSQNDEPIEYEEDLSVPVVEEIRMKQLVAATSPTNNSVPDVVPIVAEKPQPIGRSKELQGAVTTAADVETSLPIDAIAELSSLEQESSVIEALELAFKAIDTESYNLDDTAASLFSSNHSEPIYENVEEIQELYQELENEEKQQAAAAVPPKPAATSSSSSTITVPASVVDALDEPYYQVPKSSPPEPYYQVPKPRPVPLYENVEIVYNGSNLKYPTVPLPLTPTTMEPPKEKPPPPPADSSTDDDDADNTTETGGSLDDAHHTDEAVYDEIDPPLVDPMKRMNSTKRIKKEIRNKRTSFLGIEGASILDDDNFLELSVAPPPDMAAFIQEERRLEKQMYMKAGGLYDSSDTMESRDSGVSENHSRQSSEPLTTSSEEQDDYIAKQEQEIIDVLEQEERRRSGLMDMGDTTDGWHYHDGYGGDLMTSRLSEEVRMRCLEDQIREQEEVLRVERELLQLEQEELKRQRNNLLHREHVARRELDHGAKMLMSVNCHSLQDINATTNHYVNVSTSRNQQPIYRPAPADYHRQSMPNLLQAMQLHEFNGNTVTTVATPTPPAKPMRSHLSQEMLLNRDVVLARATNGRGIAAHTDVIHSRQHSAPIRHTQSIDDFVQLRQPAAQPPPPPPAVPSTAVVQQQSLTNGSTAYSNMTKLTLHALSAVPKPKLQDAWIQQKHADARRKSDYVNADNYLRSCASSTNGTNKDQRISDTWLAMSQQQQQQHLNKRKSESNVAYNYNQHWLIQEAEQRRIDQQRGLRPAPTNGWNNSIIQRKGSSDNKPLPDAIIQTLTQRVHSRGLLAERKKHDAHQSSVLANKISGTSNGCEPVTVVIPEAHKDVLSVSGKKKCSYCNDELGRGAAMIIESLRLFYHLDCFKCCVCRVQLGDGVSGADVRVRNQKLHCHNCFSSDDGIKFSCV